MAKACRPDGRHVTGLRKEAPGFTQVRISTPTWGSLPSIPNRGWNSGPSAANL